ncbi:MAG: Dinitrogenase iron-molybdenum cofactor biosynthesis protein [Geobacteraceae bacterium]|nr:Dinitrogenase iron-molybdenum cofactor biosynthesis protein [Geobacteraceae bacterium]
MLIAVASKDGESINQHFGHAERFLIYDVDGENVALTAEKAIERYCSYDPDHPLRKHLLDAIADALQGCRAVVCSQIGEAPRMEMERLGIEVFSSGGPVRQTLVELAKVL